MKENRNPNIKKQTIKKEQRITVYVQFVLLIVLIVLAVIWLFMKRILPYLMISAILFLCVGSFNSYKYFDKKKMAFLYLFGALLILVNLIFGVF